MWLKKFIEGIQNSDEWTKRRWMILFSVAATMVVVALWVLLTFYGFDSTAQQQNKIQMEEPGFWQIFKNGAGVALDVVVENIRDLISQITNKKTIIIE